VRSKTSPTAAQKRVHQALRDLGSPIKGNYGASVQLHHIFGRTAKHNKVDIGHWAVLVLPFELHDVSSGDPLNVTHCKKAFEREFGMQKDLCVLRYKLLDFMVAMGSIDLSPDDLPGKEVICAISSYTK